MHNKGKTCWDQQMHISVYNKTAFWSTSYVVKWFNSFNDIQLLRQFLKSANPSTRLVEVGCATGELYRYMRREFPTVEYVGTDISDIAISQSQRKFPQVTFHKITTSLDELREFEPHVIFCRDVMLHQSDPFGFLKKIASFPSKALILRLRSRDKGETESDPEKSCQRYGAMWAPYIVVNCDEVVQVIKDNCPRCKRLVMLKDYEILGGLNHRYLPKDCYLPETGTANLSICLEFGPPFPELEVIVKVQKRHDVTPSLIEQVLSRIRRKLYGKNVTKRITW